MTTVKPGRRFGVPALVFLAWLFVFIALAGTTLLGRSVEIELLVLAAYGAPVLAWAVLRYRAPLGPLDVAIILGITLHAAVSLASRDPQGSLQATMAVVLYAAVFWVARLVDARPELRRAAVVAIVGAILSWLVVIAITWTAEKVVSVGDFGWPPPLDAYQSFAWGSINTPPVLVLLVTPFIAWLPAGRLRTVAWATWTACALVVVPFSVGRAAWLGMAVALVAFELLGDWPVTRWVARRTRLPVRAGQVLVGAGVAVGGILVALRFEGVAAALDSRVRLWDQALALFVADPLTGSGPSTYAWARLDHVPDYVDRVASARAHNVYLETLADGGLVLACAAAVVVLAWVVVVRRDHRALDLGQRGAIAVLLGYAAVALLDDLSFLPSVTVMLVVLAAWSIPRPTASGRRGVLVPVAIVLAAVLLAPTALTAVSTRLDAAAAHRAALAADWSASRDAFQRAADGHPGNALYWMSLGLAESMLGATSAAEDAFRRATEVSPGDPRPWAARAILATDADARIALLDEAARRSNDPQYAWRLADELLATGERTRAVGAFATAVVIDPRLVAALPEHLLMEVRSALPDAITRVGPIGGRDPMEASWNADLASGDLGSQAPAQWAAVRAAAEGRSEAAGTLIGEASETAPREPVTYLAADAVAHVSCDRGDHEHAKRRLALLGYAPPAGRPAIEDRSIGLYGVRELGDYQPAGGVRVPVPPPWPLGLIEVPDCGW